MTVKNILAALGILFIGQIIYRLGTSFYGLPVELVVWLSGTFDVIALALFWVGETT
jgi:hypothetical protein